MAKKKSVKKTVKKKKPAKAKAKAKPVMPQRSKKQAPKRPARASTRKPQKPRPSQAQDNQASADAAWFDRLRAGQEKKWAGFDDMNRQWADMNKKWRDGIDAQMRGAGGGQTGMPPFADIFTQMGQPFLNLMGSAAGTREGAADLQDIVTRWLESQRGFWELLLLQNMHPPAADAASQWQRMGEHMAQNAPAFWAQMMQNNGGQNPFARMAQPMDVFADMPGIGYTREKQEDWARLYRRFLAHEEALRHYNAEMVKLALIALARFEETLKTGDLSPTSLKDIYNHWVNISEDVYARFALSDDHARTYARMVDTLSELKLEFTKLCDQWAQQLNLPTRAEIDTLHQRMHEMKRDNRELKRLLAELSGNRRKGGVA